VDRVGPYLWTDGTNGRADGLTWTCADVREDGTHPSPSGAQKVAGMLLRFFESSPTSRPWFTSGRAPRAVN
jgi:lysophospholipase L1-like esterase